MKKIIKIISLTLLISLILFVLVISISNADSTGSRPYLGHSKPTYTVNKNTTTEEMVKAMNSGKNLTGITVSVLNTNPYIYCRQRGTSLWSGTAVYQLAKGVTNPIELPGTDSNGHKKAYILSAGDYIKNDGSYGTTTASDVRQYAWWFSLGQTNGGTANDLYNIATAYQDYKKSEVQVKVTDEDSDKKTEQDGDQYIYGPIKVQYSYKKATSGSITDEWGGFSYAFFDDKNANINNKVKLCTKSGSTYTQLNYTAEGGYYRIKETTYNNKPLYIVTTDKTIGSVNLKIKATKVDYVAKVYYIEGEKYITQSTQVRCDECDDAMSSARTSIGAAIEDIEVNKKAKAYYKEGNTIYTVTKRTETVTVGEGLTAAHIYTKDGTSYGANGYVEYAPTSSTYYKCNYSSHSTPVESKNPCTDHVQNPHYCSVHSNRTICTICHSNICGNNIESELHLDGECFIGAGGVSNSNFEWHFKAHCTTVTKYSRNVYEFKKGCGGETGDKTSPCGTIISSGYYGSQALTLVDPDTKVEETPFEMEIPIKFGMAIPVEKIWNDSDNRDGLRPDSIQVTLYANGEKVTTGVGGEPVTNPITLKADKNGNWKGEFTGLDRQAFDGESVTYTIKEEGVSGVPNSYEIQSISPAEISKKKGNPDTGFKITNKHDLELVEIPITKVWDDDDDRDKIRPESVKINLYADEVKVDSITISAEDEWSGKFPSSDKVKLYKYKEGAQGVLIKYKIKEETITKTHQYNKSQKYDAPKYTTPSTSQANPSTKCKEISGTVDYHDAINDGKPETLKGFTVINTHIPEKVEIPIIKEWDDDKDRDGIRPDSIIVNLYSDDPKTEQPVQTAIIEGKEKKYEDEWTYTFTSTESEPIYKYRHNGVLINYWIEEEQILSSQSYDDSQTYAVPKYTTPSTSQENASETCDKIQGTTTYNNSAAEELVGFRIINTHIPEKVKIIVKKIWDDDNNRDNVRPNQIVFTLKADGSEVTKDAFGNSITNPVILDDEKEWTYTYENLCRYRDHGEEIEYTIDEYTIDEYTTDKKATPQYYTKKINAAEKVYDKETQIQTITLSITNKHELELVEFDITKKWEDETDRDGLRPASIKINLYADGKQVDSITIKGKNTENIWKEGHFPSSDEVKLYKYKEGAQGVLIKYTIGEEKIENVQPYDEKQRYDDPQYTNDSTSQENASTKCESISGTVDYHDSVNGGKPQSLKGFTVINRHIPEKLQIVIKKIWDDDNNRDNVRTGEVVFTLKSDGPELELDASGNPLLKVLNEDASGDPITNPATLTNSNNWTYTYKNLYRYMNHGTEINYIIEENTTPPYYYQTGMGKSASYATGSQVITLSITNKHDLELVEFDVTKVWDDDTDRDGLRPESIKLNLYADGKQVDSITIKGKNTENIWKEGHFPSSDEVKLYKYKEGAQGVLIKYTIGEEKIENVQPYDEKQRYDDPQYTNDSTSQENASTKCESISGTVDYHDSVNGGKPQSLKGFTVINKHTPEKMKVTVTKIWDDMDDLDEYRPQYITCTLLSNENGSATRAKHAATGNTGNRSNVGDIKVQDPINTGGKYSDTWGEETVENLYRYYNHGTPIVYTIQEKSIPHYNENDKNGNNKVKPESRVYYNGSGANAANPKVEITDCDHTDPKTEANKVVAITISNKHTPHYDGYVEITGRVWNDGAAGKGNDLNGLMDKGESGLKGIKVTLKNEDGTDFKCGDRTYKTETDNNGNYTIRVNIDETQKVYKMYESPESLAKRLATAYVEFEYDGGKYTTVANKEPASNASTAVEDAELRKQFDTNNTLVDKNTNPNSWKAPSTVTADTVKMDSFKINGKYNQEGRDVTVKYCTGSEYLQTNPDGAWNEILTSDKYMSPTEHPDHTTCSGSHSMSKFKIQITKIQNVNLGLFEKEQPYIALFSDLSKVEVEMLGQKYTYLYNIRSKESNNVGLKVKFENKDTYTYRRPVNPADIAYINEKTENRDAMSVTVTYEVKVGNLSTTLPITVHNIVNYFDSRYTLISPGWTTTPGGQFSQARNTGDLNIRVEPQAESEAIQLTYTVSKDAIKGLLTQQATLNNAVEIAAYSTRYGTNTLYAEQKTGGRTGQAYGGYDYNSHPGNAGIFINNEGRLEAAKLEDDTDIAPSFVLCKDKETITLSGTVWEDSDADNGSGPNNFRVGDGALTDKDGNKKVANVKVELYKVNADGTTTLAKLYNKGTNAHNEEIDAITYTDNEGNYSFGDDNYGVVTDTYMIKFTYGDAIEKDGSLKDFEITNE